MPPAGARRVAGERSAWGKCGTGQLWERRTVQRSADRGNHECMAHGGNEALVYTVTRGSGTNEHAVDVCAHGKNGARPRAIADRAFVAKPKAARAGDATASPPEPPRP